MITLATRSTEFGEITILKSRVKGSHIYCQEDWFQSEADGNGVSLAAYVHAIFGLVSQTPAHDVLMIGCGGGTLGTMLAKTGRLVTIVDINPASIALAQEYFSLPAIVTCCVEDGRAYLQHSQALFDSIVIDAFMDDRVPPHLCSMTFFHLARQRLSPSGCLFLNVLLQHGSDLSADVIAGSMADAAFQVRVLAAPRPRERNAIVMGGAVAGLRRPTLLVKPEVLQDEIIAQLDRMHFRGGRRSWNSSTGADPVAIISEPQTP
jgi:spermidine synthase